MKLKIEPFQDSEAKLYDFYNNTECRDGTGL